MTELRTPRTDAEESEIIPSRDPNYDGEYRWVPSRLARQLERELSEAQDERDDYRARYLESLENGRRKANSHNAALTAVSAEAERYCAALKLVATVPVDGNGLDYYWKGREIAKAALGHVPCGEEGKP